MLHTFFDFRRVSTLMALLLITALAAIMFASAPAATQTTPADATATPTTTATATATPTTTPTPDPDATATPTATATATPDPDATATPTATATATPTATPTPDPNATATPTATATATATPTVPPLNADYDVDNDGLIEIRTLPQLNAIRYDLNGNGKQDSVSASDWAIYTTAFLNAASDMGCQLTDHDSDSSTPQQATCTGYELMENLTFDTNGDGGVDSTDPNSYPVWTPIGTAANPFNATFKGNSNGSTQKIATISDFTITGGATELGLFGATGSNAHIEGVGLVGVHVSPPSSTTTPAKFGVLVGSNAGRITSCYSSISVIFAVARTGSYAGGLVGYNTGTITASFSRTDVSMSIDDAVTGRMDVSAGGLAGYNSGTLTAVYSLGAVRGNGRSDTYGYMGGLVGDNNGTITASYSIGPVTVDTASALTVGGLVGNSGPSARVNASYWDYISSGVDDDSDNTMPEGKSTYDLLTPTSAAGIYADWDDLTIDTDGANNDDPWDFSRSYLHPQLAYGGHATAFDLSGNQRLASIKIASQHGGYAVHPREGMTFASSGAGGYPPLGLRAGVWMWESSTDGIHWTILSPLPGKYAVTLRGIGGDFGGTHFFIPRAEHVGKYIRSAILLTTGDYLTSRPIGKIKAATAAAALSLADSTRIEREITVESLPSGAVGLWYRCAANSAKPPTTGCEMVGSRASYTPDSADIGHYLYAYIYYKNASGAWLRSEAGFTQYKVWGYRSSPWRNPSD